MTPSHTSIAPCRPASIRGLSIVELLLALAITSMLLTATMVATQASFRAYADAAEQASAQAGTRMVAQRLLTLVRTSTAHGPLMPDAAAEPPVTLAGNIITSAFIELLDPRDNLVRIEYRPDQQELWLITTPPSGTAQPQPLLSGVTQAIFSGLRRRNDQGLWILDRGTVDITVQPGADNTLDIERGHGQAIRLIASTAPRKLE